MISRQQLSQLWCHAPSCTYSVKIDRFARMIPKQIPAVRRRSFFDTIYFSMPKVEQLGPGTLGAIHVHRYLYLG